MANKGRANLIPGSHKLTDEDRKKAQESRRINSSMRKIARKIRGFAVNDEDDIALFDEYDIPVQERTIGTLIVLRAAIGASLGNKDDRRDYLRMTGDDPDVAAKEAEVELKKALQEKPDESSAVADDPCLAVLEQIRGAVNDAD